MVDAARWMAVGFRCVGFVVGPGLCVSARLAKPGRFSVAEVVLLVGCVVGSGTLFLGRFGPILRTILRSKKDADFSLWPIGRRVWEFAWEVLCQAKVIRQRPLPGLAHAFVFWGFLAFALVSLNHLASGVGLGFLPSEGYVGEILFFVCGGLGAAGCGVNCGAVCAAVLCAAVWLGAKVSYESGLIALLIFTLMGTYLAAFFVSDGGTAVKALWWTHTLALLVFLPLIPHTKHLHLVLSPLTVFLKREGFSKIPPLSGDDDFGLVAGKDITQLISLQAYSCVECGRCTEHCPASATGKVLNPKEIILGMRSYLNELGPGVMWACCGGEAGDLRLGRLCRWRRRLSVRRAGAVSISVPWGSASADHCRVATRGYEYGGLGRWLWDEAVSGARKEWKCAGAECGGAG